MTPEWAYRVYWAIYGLSWLVLARFFLVDPLIDALRKR